MRADAHNRQAECSDAGQAAGRAVFLIDEHLPPGAVRDVFHCPVIPQADLQT